MKFQLMRRLIPHPLKSSYYIGFLKECELSLPVNERYAKIKWMNATQYEDEGWFADPFIVSVTDNEIELFAEEMIYKTGRGILVYLKVERDSYEVLEKKTILDLDTHLSFPIYIEDGGEIYVYPENYQSGELKIYKYDEKTKKLLNPRTIIVDSLLDTQIVRIDGAFYAFGVRYRTGRQEDTKSLFVYRAEQLMGEYKCVQKMENLRCEERGAGLIYFENDRIIRPAQCCEGGYGREVILYELCKNHAGFKEVEIGRVTPDRNAKKGNVLHTCNKMKGIVVIDGWAYQNPRLALLYKKVRGIKD
jgi:hypothetical protein